MSNNKNPNEKRPGEKPEGTFHFNPGNQSGKKVKVVRQDNEAPEEETKKDDRSDGA